jgi:flagellar biosynthesis/type III secretory pathway protein FliH
MAQKSPQPPADGPAKVLRQQGGNASLGAFAFAQFHGGTRPASQAKPGDDVRIADLAHKLRVAEESHRQAMDAQRAERIYLEQESFEKGFAEAKVQAEKAARKRYDEGLTQLREAVNKGLHALESESQLQAIAMENLTVELVGQALDQSLGRLPEFSADAVLHALRACAQSLGKSVAVTVKVHPEEVDVVEGEKDFWLGLDADLEKVKVSPDSRIPRGGCHVESDFTSASMDWTAMARRLGQAISEAHSLRRGKAGLEPLAVEDSAEKKTRLTIDTSRSVASTQIDTSSQEKPILETRDSGKKKPENFVAEPLLNGSFEAPSSKIDTEKLSVQTDGTTEEAATHLMPTNPGVNNEDFPDEELIDEMPTDDGPNLVGVTDWAPSDLEEQKDESPKENQDSESKIAAETSQQPPSDTQKKSGSILESLGLTEIDIATKSVPDSISPEALEADPKTNPKSDPKIDSESAPSADPLVDPNADSHA